MCDFLKEDVIKIAKAIMSDPIEYMEGDYKPYFYCIHCNAEMSTFTFKEGYFQHDLDCPVLVAQDILTNYK